MTSKVSTELCYFITSKDISDKMHCSESVSKRMIKVCKDAKNIKNRKLTLIEFLLYYDLVSHIQ